VSAIAAAVVLLTMLAMWQRAGVTIGEAARFGVYEVFYVFLPGWLLYKALQPRTASRLREVVFSVALGQVAEVLAFALTAGIGARWLFALYPLAFLLLAGLIRALRRGPRPDASGPWATWHIDPRALPAWSLALAAVCLLSLAYLELTHFLSTPLPGQIGGTFTYEHDYLFHLSLAGEALNHWPLTNPNVAGTQMNYHWFSHIQMAGITQVTGIPLPTVFFALVPTLLLLLLLCEVALSGALLGGILWAGPIAAFLLIFVGEIDLSMQEPAPFLEQMPIYLRYSPSFLFGATLFVPLLLALCETLQAERSTWRQWCLIAILAVGCSGGEGAILPLIAGGLAGFLAYRWLITRRLDRQTAIALGIVGLTLVAAAVVLYGGESAGLSIAFLRTAEAAPPFTFALSKVPGGLHGLYWALSTLLLMLFLFGASLVGLLWPPRRLTALRAQEAVPLALFACGALALVFLVQTSSSQEYFAMYGAMAVIPISAAGLVRMLSAWRRAPDSRAWPALAFAALCLVAFWAIVFNRHLGAYDGAIQRYLRPYALLVVAVAVLAIWAWRSRPPLRAGRALYPAIVILAAAAINTPTDDRSRLGHLWSGDVVQVEQGPGLSTNLYRGLRWIESHTSTDTVLAVDNLRTPGTRGFAPLYFYVAAFAERRTLLQGWAYTPRSHGLGFAAVNELEIQPFPQRLRLENEAFDHASRTALNQLKHRYGVTGLVVYRSNGRATSRLRRIARLVYANPAIEVYSVGEA
jgi:hypothetical protein